MFVGDQLLTHGCCVLRDSQHRHLERVQVLLDALLLRKVMLNRLELDVNFLLEKGELLVHLAVEALDAGRHGSIGRPHRLVEQVGEVIVVWSRHATRAQRGAADRLQRHRRHFIRLLLMQDLE